MVGLPGGVEAAGRIEGESVVAVFDGCREGVAGLHVVSRPMDVHRGPRSGVMPFVSKS
jgi:hypothetical protein